jgi:hypothetical protein
MKLEKVMSTSLLPLSHSIQFNSHNLLTIKQFRIQSCYSTIIFFFQQFYDITVYIDELLLHTIPFYDRSPI